MARLADPAIEESDGDFSLTVPRNFDTPPAAVVRAWTEGAKVGRWIGPLLELKPIQRSEDGLRFIVFWVRPYDLYDE